MTTRPAGIVHAASNLDTTRRPVWSYCAKGFEEDAHVPREVDGNVDRAWIHEHRGAVRQRVGWRWDHGAAEDLLSALDGQVQREKRSAERIGQLAQHADGLRVDDPELRAFSPGSPEMPLH